MSNVMRLRGDSFADLARRRLGALRREVAERGHDETLDAELAERFGADAASARNLREYMAEQRAVTGVVPDDRTMVIEQFRDELGAVRLVVHSIFGGRVNAPWGMALAQRLLLCSPISVALTKRGIYRAETMDPAEADQMGLDTVTIASAGPDWKEGMTAFREKRAPAFAANGVSGGRAGIR